MASEKAKEYNKKFGCAHPDCVKCVERMLAFDVGQAAKEAELKAERHGELVLARELIAKARVDESIAETRERFALEYPDSLTEGKLQSKSAEVRWSVFARGAGHPRGTKFKD